MPYPSAYPPSELHIRVVYRGFSFPLLDGGATAADAEAPRGGAAAAEAGAPLAWFLIQGSDEISGC